MDIVQTCLQDLLIYASDVQVDAHKESKKKDFKMMFFILQCIDMVNFQKIENEASSKETWDIIEKGHVDEDNLKKVCL